MLLIIRSHHEQSRLRLSPAGSAGSTGATKQGIDRRKAPEPADQSANTIARYSREAAAMSARVGHSSSSPTCRRSARSNRTMPPGRPLAQVVYSGLLASLFAGASLDLITTRNP